MDTKRDVRLLDSRSLAFLGSPGLRAIALVFLLVGTSCLALIAGINPGDVRRRAGQHHADALAIADQNCPETPSTTVITVTETVKIVVTVAAAVPKQDVLELEDDEEVVEDAPSSDDRGRKSSFDTMYRSKGWGDGESLSGTGSYLDYTVNARRFISAVLKTFKLDRILDAPCGDCNWQWAIPEIRRGVVEYTGIDIVQSVILENTLKRLRFPNMRFAAMDFVSRDDVLLPANLSAHTNPAPLWDVINCRDAIQHIHVDDGLRAVVNFESSGAKYLVSGWYSAGASQGNLGVGNIPSGHFYAVDLMLPPFNFPKPLFWTLDGWNYDYDSLGQPNMKMMGVWKLPALGKGDGTSLPLNVTQLWEWWENPSLVQIMDSEGNPATEIDDPGRDSMLDV
ncbi:hypothetical protein M427DRAFT_51973 [Gonapodya prolifera JEL478]|uniref:Methyltransferase domain-containing protein n=1 Tax=Gonapodya prolifera (strain JEL478) TaxID=1344416 RepID=A0A139AWE1_GONPJ|nr:hypothetical protein M427DRAFT_51973 [Gonapodya prolifera JEL478]|eukprot:KXS21038.1 hypothetical protein M427DRAFT_51973 [Gonapodya prolifera JEL478]